jgi:hypothetical protein
LSTFNISADTSIGDSVRSPICRRSGPAAGDQPVRVGEVDVVDPPPHEAFNELTTSSRVLGLQRQRLAADDHIVDVADHRRHQAAVLRPDQHPRRPPFEHSATRLFVVPRSMPIPRPGARTAACRRGRLGDLKQRPRIFNHVSSRVTSSMNLWK